jgi:hypothetical protein
VPIVREPARRYSWPPLEPGHTLTLRHGARSHRTIAPLAESLAAELVESAPWVGHPAFRSTLERWAFAEAQCIQRREWISEHGLLAEDGSEQHSSAELARNEATAAKAAAELGLSPAAMVRVLAGLSQVSGDDAATEALESLSAVGRDLVARRQAELGAGS